MATADPHPTAPKAFVSYSWDDEAHREWVKQLASRLRQDGVDVTLDRWHAAPGDQIPAFMERAVSESDFVIVVCTPRFKERLDRRGGGVGYEGDIITAFAFTSGDKKKVIPVLRRGSWIEAAPTWLRGTAHIDLSGEPYSESEYEELRRTLHGAREAAPPIGQRPDFGDKRWAQALPFPQSAALPSTPPAPRYEASITPGFAFDEVEPDRPVPHDQLSWMNASYLMGVVMTRAFADSGECKSISGPRSEGRLERLPGFLFRTDDGDLDRQGPTEVVLTGRRREELSNLGFLPLCHFKDTDSAVFLGARTARKPEIYMEPEATRDAVIGSRLPCIMVVSRFMIYINLMVQELVAKGRDAEELVSMIGRWIDGYVDSSPDADERRRASHPLREAKVVLEQMPGRPGSCAIVVHLRPWLPLEELSAPVRMEVRFSTSTADPDQTTGR